MVVQTTACTTPQNVQLDGLDKRPGKESTRLFTVRSGDAELALFLPHNTWQEAEQFKDAVQLGDCSQADLLVALSMKAEEGKAFDLARLLMDELESRYLKDNDPHAVLPGELKKTSISDALACYYRLRSVHKGLPGLFNLAEKGITRVICVFGGQGNTEDYIGELEEILRAYHPLIGPLFSTLCECLFGVSGGSVDLGGWLEKRPQDPMLIQSPSVSLPLAGIIQLLNYAILGKATGTSIGDLPGLFSRFTGHSQGIVSAIVAAASESDPHFGSLSVRAIKLLYFIGLRTEQVFPRMSLPPSILSDCAAHGEGSPTPMLFVYNLSYDQLQAHIDAANAIFPEHRRIHIALHNGPRSFVCSGPAISLHGLNVALRKLKANHQEDQSRIPHSKRKLKFGTRFLPISVPFHCPYLGRAVELVLQDLAEHAVSFDNLSLHSTVVCPYDGSDMSSVGLTKELISLICVKPVHWSKATECSSVTHIVDFGPGGLSGIGALTMRNKEGSGVRVILGSAIGPAQEVAPIDDRRSLFDRRPESVKFGLNWRQQFGPQVVRRETDGRLFVDTRFSRLLGLPPVMVAGMTPCTVSRTFVSACINAGYHVELAGGGHFTEAMLRDKIDAILEDIPAGRGITLNSLFLNPRLWAIQYPLMKKMRAEGYPIEGFCVAAGVPSLDNANGIVRSLHEAGIRHISFKPGSIDSIYQVIGIARHNPDVPIVLQWTGGRGGGHHSFEDFHHPILETYAACRSVKNLILVAGSGFGDGPDSLAYLTGQWSEKYSYPWMPFDGILIGSRVMVARENQASESVKDLLVAAAGAKDETEWEGTFSSSVGSITNVVSELGEPIHKVATRAVLLWRDLDEQVFSLPRGEKRLKTLLARKAYWIDRLNSDHMKVWFGRRADGSVCDLEDMTYEEVLNRLLQLCYIHEQQRWIDGTYRALLFEFSLIAQSRFASSDVDDVAMVSSPDALAHDPHSTLCAFLSCFPEMSRTLLRSEDIDAFIQLCMNPARKPVPFIPVFDDNFDVWFKKDSLWASEDVDGVVGQDAQRTCILQGPVAVKYSTQKNVPVKDILDSINDYYIQQLVAAQPAVAVPWFGLSHPRHVITNTFLPLNRVAAELDREIVLCPDSGDLNNPERWFARLCGGRLDWFTVSLQSVCVVGERKRLEANPFLSLFKPRAGYSYRLAVSDGVAERASIECNGRVVVEALSKEKGITLAIFHDALETVTLLLNFKFDPTYSPSMLHVENADRESLVRDFYSKLWFGRDFDALALQGIDPRVQPIQHSAVVNAGKIKEFCGIVGNNCAAYSGLMGETCAPMDFAIILAWKSIIQCLFTDPGSGNLLHLVHLRNKVFAYHGSTLQPNDKIDTSATITAILGDEQLGKTVEVTAECRKGGLLILKVITAFLYRKNQPHEQFVHFSPSSYSVPIKTDEDVAIIADLLKEKSWFTAIPNWKLKVSAGYDLVFYCNQKSAIPCKNGFRNLQVKGHVTAMFSGHLSIPCGQIDFHHADFIKGDPVEEFCKRHHGTHSDADIKRFESTEGMQPLAVVSAPLSAQRYSQCSGDFNPIHSHELLADLLGLPSGPIIHGMWTSAAVRAVLELHLAENCPARIIEYEARFTAMVAPGSLVHVAAEHIGMRTGRLVYNFEGRTSEDQKVIEGSIVVDPRTTAYLLTGQGSQQVKMGMDLYEESAVARNIWERAEKHFLKTYGVSIMDIVRNNPQEITVHFGGLAGHQIRLNYMSLTYEDPSDKTVKQMIPSITEQSDSYTFFSPTGLLNATQFTQPALTLVAKAAFEDMKMRGLVSVDCAFAGHSLGEYASLAAVGDVIPIDTLCDIVFYRGLTMQAAVQRDAQGRSDYGMIAVNPTRISPDFKEEALCFVVEGVCSQLDQKDKRCLLEIVNYNVQDGQYVVAGELMALEVLTQTLNYIKHKAVRVAECVKQMSVDEVKRQLKEMVALVAREVCKDGGKVMEVSKGYASVQLVGIDVPFHSSYLLAGVGPFRSILRKKLDPALVSVERLCGRYIPNLVGSIFDLTVDFCQEVFDASHSPVIGRILKSFPELGTVEAKQSLAYTLLVELLAYQFASPVQWIKTQDVLFGQLKIERIIEVGPAAILTGMAEKTIKAKYAAQDDVLSTKRTIWSFSGHRSEIYYESKRRPVGSVVAVADVAAGTADVVAVSAEKIDTKAPPTPPSPSISNAVATNEPVTFTALDALRTSLCVKLKRPLKDISMNKSIKEMSGGKSTLQNELLADLQREFGDSGIPDRAEELSLADLGGAISNYSAMPKKHTSMLLNKLWSAKMPAGLTMAAAQNYLAEQYGLDARSGSAVLLFSPCLEPEKRLLNEADAFTWVDSLVKLVGEVRGVALHKVSKVAGSAASGVVVSSAELSALREEQKTLARLQVDALCSFLGDSGEQVLRKLLATQEAHIAQLETEQQEWLAEHGPVYASGIQSMFSVWKARRFDSHWNWGKQELFVLMFETMSGRFADIDRSVMERCGRLLNKAEPELVAFMEYHLVRRRPELARQGEQDQRQGLLLRLGTELLELMRGAMHQPPRFKDLSHPTAPTVAISADGSVRFAEVLRKNTRNFVQYASEMERPFEAEQKSGMSLARKLKSRTHARKVPLLSLRKPDPESPLHWKYSASATAELFSCLRETAEDGLCLSKKAILITGCGRGSIGGEVLKAVLSAGAMVLATTSSYSTDTLSYYRELYEEWGAKGSVLVVVPFNQASVRDIHLLVAYATADLHWDLDYFLPFAAINEAGAAIDNLTDKNDLAHRAMLTNIHKMLGAIVGAKQSNTRPVHCILPMSPNEGTFGGDGFYGESKAGLQALLHRWSAEQWADRATLVGAVIGWTRGTALMNDNNMLAAAMEGEFGIRTFSPREMAFNIVSLMHPRLSRLALKGPVYADLTGGLSYLRRLSRATGEVRSKLLSASRLKKALYKEKELEAALYTSAAVARPSVKARSALSFKFNRIERGDTRLGAKLRRLLDLDSVVVIVGYGEVGPYGSARTRWEIEAHNRFSSFGYIEMAWTMGLVVYQKSAQFGKYSGWIDAKSKEPIEEWDIPVKYGEHIMKHCGIRLIEPETMYGYDPKRKEQCQELVLSDDLPVFETSKEEADAYLRQHGPALCEVLDHNSGAGERIRVRLKKGAKIFVPKAASMDRLVAGLVPRGWDARRFGVPDDIVSHVDPISVYNLVSTCEALCQAGITDPYELYTHCHPSQVGNCSGGGEGGLKSNQLIFKSRFFDQPVQSDILQESFISTMPAWVNLLLMSSSGPVKSPVGACATAVQSIELGVECIQSGKAQVVIVGGYDDISEESSCEFASMQATSSTLEEQKRGRPPREQCRPASSTRAGFMEAHGSGSQVLMSARLALELGCPVYGIVAGTSTASDRQGRSIPAPGQGLLTTARRSKVPNDERNILDVDYRLSLMRPDDEPLHLGTPESANDIQQQLRVLKKMEKLALGHDFWKGDPRIAPLEGMLAQFGLSIDNVHMASFHGTGTKANDVNESDVLQKQLQHLDRSVGNLLPCVFQKHLTGHPKGAACAWMLNGCLQAMDDSLIPGNRNADNIDPALRDKSFLLFLNKSIQVAQIDAVMLKSFGFGQVGGEAVIVHPRLFYSLLTDAEYAEYRGKRRQRELKAIRYFNNSLLSNTLVQVKTAAPYKDEDQSAVLLNPLMRRQPDGSWTADKDGLLTQLASSVSIQPGACCGIDIQYIPDLSAHCPVAKDNPFIAKNFTENELLRVGSKPDQPASLAGMWAAKEAAFKALSQAGLVEGRGAAASLIELEVVYSPAPSVQYNNRTVRLSISHSGDYATAVAVLD